MPEKPGSWVTRAVSGAEWVSKTKLKSIQKILYKIGPDLAMASSLAYYEVWIELSVGTVFIDAYGFLLAQPVGVLFTWKPRQKMPTEVNTNTWKWPQKSN